MTKGEKFLEKEVIYDMIIAVNEKGEQVFVSNLIDKALNEQLILSGVGSSNDKKDQIINKEYIIVDSKDGLWDVYDTNGCLGTGLNNEEVNRVTRK